MINAASPNKQFRYHPLLEKIIADDLRARETTPSGILKKIRGVKKVNETVPIEAASVIQGVHPTSSVFSVTDARAITASMISAANVDIWLENGRIDLQPEKIFLGERIPILHQVKLRVKEFVHEFRPQKVRFVVTRINHLLMGLVAPLIGWDSTFLIQTLASAYFLKFVTARKFFYFSMKAYDKAITWAEKSEGEAFVWKMPFKRSLNKAFADALTSATPRIKQMFKDPTSGIAYNATHGVLEISWGIDPEDARELNHWMMAQISSVERKIEALSKSKDKRSELKEHVLLKGQLDSLRFKLDHRATLDLAGKWQRGLANRWAFQVPDTFVLPAALAGSAGVYLHTVEGKKVLQINYHLTKAELATLFSAAGLSVELIKQIKIAYKIIQKNYNAELAGRNFLQNIAIDPVQLPESVRDDQKFLNKYFFKEGQGKGTLTLRSSAEETIARIRKDAADLSEDDLEQLETQIRYTEALAITKRDQALAEQTTTTAAPFFVPINMLHSSVHQLATTPLRLMMLVNNDARKIFESTAMGMTAEARVIEARMFAIISVLKDAVGLDTILEGAEKGARYSRNYYEVALHLADTYGRNVEKNVILAEAVEEAFPADGRERQLMYAYLNLIHLQQNKDGIKYLHENGGQQRKIVLPESETDTQKADRKIRPDEVHLADAMIAVAKDYNEKYGAAEVNEQQIRDFVQIYARSLLLHKRSLEVAELVEKLVSYRELQSADQMTIARFLAAKFNIELKQARDMVAALVRNIDQVQEITEVLIDRNDNAETMNNCRDRDMSSEEFFNTIRYVKLATFSDKGTGKPYTAEIIPDDSAGVLFDRMDEIRSRPDKKASADYKALSKGKKSFSKVISDGRTAYKLNLDLESGTPVYTFEVFARSGAHTEYSVVVNDAAFIVKKNDKIVTLRDKKEMKILKQLLAKITKAQQGNRMQEGMWSEFHRTWQHADANASFKGGLYGALLAEIKMNLRKQYSLNHTSGTVFNEKLLKYPIIREKLQEIFTYQNDVVINNKGTRYKVQRAAGGLYEVSIGKEEEPGSFRTFTIRSVNDLNDKLPYKEIKKISALLSELDNVLIPKPVRSIPANIWQAIPDEAKAMIIEASTNSFDIKVLDPNSLDSKWITNRAIKISRMVEDIFRGNSLSVDELEWEVATRSITDPVFARLTKFEQYRRLVEEELDNIKKAFERTPEIKAVPDLIDDMMDTIREGFYMQMAAVRGLVYQMNKVRNGMAKLEGKDLFKAHPGADPLIQEWMQLIENKKQDYLAKKKVLAAVPEVRKPIDNFFMEKFKGPLSGYAGKPNETGYWGLSMIGRYLGRTMEKVLDPSKLKNDLTDDVHILGKDLIATSKSMSRSEILSTFPQLAEKLGVLFENPLSEVLVPHADIMKRIRKVSFHSDPRMDSSIKQRFIEHLDSVGKQYLGGQENVENFMNRPICLMEYDVLAKDFKKKYTVKHVFENELPASITELIGRVDGLSYDKDTRTLSIPASLTKEDMTWLKKNLHDPTLFQIIKNGAASALALLPTMKEVTDSIKAVTELLEAEAELQQDLIISLETRYGITHDVAVELVAFLFEKGFIEQGAGSMAMYHKKSFKTSVVNEEGKALLKPALFKDLIKRGYLTKEGVLTGCGLLATKADALMNGLIDKEFLLEKVPEAKNVLDNLFKNPQAETLEFKPDTMNMIDSLKLSVADKRLLVALLKRSSLKNYSPQTLEMIIEVFSGNIYVDIHIAPKEFYKYFYKKEHHLTIENRSFGYVEKSAIEKLAKELSEELIEELINAQYITRDGEITKKTIDMKKPDDLKIADRFKASKGPLFKLLKDSVRDFSDMYLDMVGDYMTRPASTASPVIKTDAKGETYVEVKIGTKTYDVYDATMFHVHRNIPTEASKQKPQNHNFMYLGTNPFENIQKTIKVLIQWYRWRDGTASMQQVWDEMRSEMMKDTVSVQMLSTAYKGVQYDFWTEVQKWVDIMNDPLEQPSLRLLRENTDIVDQRRNNNRILHELFTTVAERRIAQATPQEKDLAFKVRFARRTMSEIVDVSFEDNLDKDNFVYKFCTKPILNNFKPEYFNAAKMGKIVNETTVLIQADQDLYYIQFNQLQQSGVFDMLDARNTLSYWEGTHGYRANAGCDQWHNRKNDMLFKIVRSVCEIQPAQSTHTAPNIGDRLFTFGGAAAITIGTGFLVKSLLALLPIPGPVFMFVAPITVAYLAYKMYPWLIDVFAKQTRKFHESAKIFGMKLPFIKPDRFKPAKVTFRIEFTKQYSSVEDYRSRTEMVKSMVFAIQVYSMFMAAESEADWDVQVEVQFPRWNNAHLELVPVERIDAKYFRKFIKHNHLSSEVFKEYVDMYVEATELNKYPMITLYMTKFSEIVTLFAALGISVFTFQGSILGWLFGPVIGIGLFGSLAIAEYLMLMRAITRHHEVEGVSKRDENVAKNRFFLINGTLMPKILDNMFSLAKAKFITSEPVKRTMRRAFPDLYLRYPEFTSLITKIPAEWDTYMKDNNILHIGSRMKFKIGLKVLRKHVERSLANEYIAFIKKHHLKEDALNQKATVDNFDERAIEAIKHFEGISYDRNKKTLIVSPAFIKTDEIDLLKKSDVSRFAQTIKKLADNAKISRVNRLKCTVQFMRKKFVEKMKLTKEIWRKKTPQFAFWSVATWVGAGVLDGLWVLITLGMYSALFLSFLSFSLCYFAWLNKRDLYDNLKKFVEKGVVGIASFEGVLEQDVPFRRRVVEAIEARKDNIQKQDVQNVEVFEDVGRVRNAINVVKAKAKAKALASRKQG